MRLPFAMDSLESTSQCFHLFKLATPSDAMRLRKRCLRRKFFSVRQGLTAAERQTAALCHQRVQELNGLNTNSETMFIRKFLFSIAEVCRSNPKRL